MEGKALSGEQLRNLLEIPDEERIAPVAVKVLTRALLTDEWYNKLPQDVREKLSQPQYQQFFIEVAKGLQYVHGRFHDSAGMVVLSSALTDEQGQALEMAYDAAKDQFVVSFQALKCYAMRIQRNVMMPGPAGPCSPEKAILLEAVKAGAEACMHKKIRSVGEPAAVIQEAAQMFRDGDAISR